jgi:hypothetical protein
MPLLANDPHMYPRFPSVFYEAHLAAGGDLNVAGASIPGAPGILIGHNRHIAWGLTAAMSDIQDLYVERLDPGDSRRTEHAGRWETGTTIREIIAIGAEACWVRRCLPPATGRCSPPPQAWPTGTARWHRSRRPAQSPAPRRWTQLRHLGTNFLCRRAGAPPRQPGLRRRRRQCRLDIGRARPRARRGRSPPGGAVGTRRGSIAFDDLPRAFNPRTACGPTPTTTSQNTAALSPRFIDWPGPAYRQVLESKDRHSAVDFGAAGRRGQLPSPSRGRC